MRPIRECSFFFSGEGEKFESPVCCRLCASQQGSSVERVVFCSHASCIEERSSVCLDLAAPKVKEGRSQVCWLPLSRQQAVVFVYTDTHSHAHFFSVLSFLTHLDAQRTLSALFYGSRSDCQHNFLKSSLLTCLTRVQRKPHPRLGHIGTTPLSLSVACLRRAVWRNEHSTGKHRLEAQQ